MDSHWKKWQSRMAKAIGYGASMADWEEKYPDEK